MQYLDKTTSTKPQHCKEPNYETDIFLLQMLEVKKPPGGIFHLSLEKRQCPKLLLTSRDSLKKHSLHLQSTPKRSSAFICNSAGAITLLHFIVNHRKLWKLLKPCHCAFISYKQKNNRGAVLCQQPYLLWRNSRLKWGASCFHLLLVFL